MKFIEIIMVFLFVIVLGYMALGFVSVQPEPAANTTAAAQYDNLSKTTEIGFSGFNGAIYLLIIAVVMAGVFMILWAVKR